MHYLSQALPTALLGLTIFFSHSVQAQDCTSITSDIKRLACFDSMAGTPPAADHPELPAALQPAPLPEIIALLQGNESQRTSDTHGFILRNHTDTDSRQTRLVLSSPAQQQTLLEPYLVISCLSNISRLQLVVAAPLTVDRVELQLWLDGQALTPPRTWQVLDDGRVIDAGRGLIAIEQLRYLTRVGEQLRIESNHAAFDGLSFDAFRLHALMSQQRQACHW